MYYVMNILTCIHGLLLPEGYVTAVSPVAERVNTLSLIAILPLIATLPGTCNVVTSPWAGKGQAIGLYDIDGSSKTVFFSAFTFQWRHMRVMAFQITGTWLFIQQFRIAGSLWEDSVGYWWSFS